MEPLDLKSTIPAKQELTPEITKLARNGDCFLRNRIKYTQWSREGGVYHGAERT